MLASCAKALHTLRACTAAEACWLITSATKACWHMAHPLMLFHLIGPCFLSCGKLRVSLGVCPITLHLGLEEVCAPVLARPLPPWP